MLALEAQFPEQSFAEIRHPRVESVDDLQLAVATARGRPAVMVYTLVEPGLREAMRQLCRRARVHYCDLLGPPDRLDRPRLGRRGADDAGCPAAARPDVLQANRGDRVRRQVRRRRGERPRRGGRGARRRLPDLEDAALDLPRLPRPQGGKRPDREGDRPAADAVRDRSGQDRRADDRCGAALGDPPQPRRDDGRPEEAVRGTARRLRGARPGDGNPPPARLSRARTSRTSRSRRRRCA